ncbi:Transposase [Cordylochernes scorpioides]|uniref:Transposase n=2 Tax=Cordylochernes scorpioides TaxID=51811 RepID=A0ABY6K3Q9_9ARAC|nr:Transposase [Cordylochernes scorpioides]
MVWKKPEESAPKKAKVTISAGKVMAIVFWDSLKLHFGGKHFANDDEVQAEANHWLRRQDTAWYNSGIKKRYQKCLDRNDYFLSMKMEPVFLKQTIKFYLSFPRFTQSRNIAPVEHPSPTFPWYSQKIFQLHIYLFIKMAPVFLKQTIKFYLSFPRFTQSRNIAPVEHPSPTFPWYFQKIFQLHCFNIETRLGQQRKNTTSGWQRSTKGHNRTGGQSDCQNGCHSTGFDVIYHPITISRRLVTNGLHSCRPLRRLTSTPPNRRQRLEWCRARSTWMTEWHRVVFSDESRFCLSSDSRRVRVWRRRGERSNPAAIVERPTVRQRGIMVWGAIAYDSRSPLLRIQGTMTAQRYVDDVLRPVTLPYLQGIPNALYQQDNARPHTARISQQALQDVQMLPWPPYSPDLSPIEHVWDIIGRRLHALPQPRSEDELWQMVEREWRAIPQDAIRTLIDSLPRRVAACIAVRGGPTCY